jgi:hypothetical protein
LLGEGKEKGEQQARAAELKSSRHPHGRTASSIGVQQRQHPQRQHPQCGMMCGSSYYTKQKTAQNHSKAKK